MIRMEYTYLFTAILYFIFIQHAESLRALVIGDWGLEVNATNRASQENVAKAMGQYVQDHPDTAYIVTTGDNFYPNGVDSADSLRFNTTWREVYWRPEYPVMRSLPWYICLGNHDHLHHRSHLYEVEFSASEEQWVLPWLWHDWVQREEGFTVHWVVLDSDLLVTNQPNADEQSRWLEESLSGSNADYVIVVAHHPIFNVGGNESSLAMRERVLPLLDQHHVDVYITGHDHNLQHINHVNYSKKGPHTDYVISGGGGADLYPMNSEALFAIKSQNYELRYFESNHGFVTLEFNRHRMSAKFYSLDNNNQFKQSYSFTRKKQRRVASNA